MKKYLFALTILVFPHINLFSVHNSDSTPHGGRVIEATDGYHIERVMGIGKNLTFYLLEKDAISTIKNTQLSGSVIISLKNKTQLIYELIKRNDESMLAKIREKRSDIDSYTVTINYIGKPITAKFIQ